MPKNVRHAVPIYTPKSNVMVYMSTEWIFVWAATARYHRTLPFAQHAIGQS